MDMYQKREIRKNKKAAIKKIQLHTNLPPSRRTSIMSNKLNKIGKNVNKTKHYKKVKTIKKRKLKVNTSDTILTFYRIFFSYSFSS